jgi:endonuclease/exonuclease/phosphatase family metal-dependent hydrolase
MVKHMKIVTFNIRCDCKVDLNNNFEYRKPYILKKIESEKPDIICFQEVMSHVAWWLNDSLLEYVVVGCGRDENLGGEQMSIAYRKDQFFLLALHNFWHSDTPNIPGSHFPEQSIFPRLCTEAYLIERASNKIIRVVNTHLDHISVEARRKELEFVMQTISKVSMYKEHITILVGDLNAEPNTIEMKVMNSYPDFKCLTNDVGFTFHNYFRKEKETDDDPSAQIDYIYARGDIVLKSVEKWTDEHEGVYLSDHYPVLVEIELLK